eukprot:PITA_03552
MKLGFTRSDVDPNLYFKIEKDKPLILVLYVDDLFLIGDDPLIHQSKRELAPEFEMKDLGLDALFPRARGLAKARKQKSVALSTAEGEYIVVSMAFCEVFWLRKLFSELFEHVLDTTVIFCDNQSWIRLSENPMFHDRSKNINIRYHFIRDMVQWGAIRLQHIKTDEQVTNILTKPLGKFKFLTFCEKLGVVERPSYEGLV